MLRIWREEDAARARYIHVAAVQYSAHPSPIHIRTVHMYIPSTRTLYQVGTGSLLYTPYYLVTPIYEAAALHEVDRNSMSAAGEQSGDVGQRGAVICMYEWKNAHRQ